MARKRAAGGGRKPRGGFRGKTRTFTTRITSATRAALEQAARESGWSLSQEAERRLDESFGRDRKWSRAPHVRALGYAINKAIAQVEARTERSFVTDPFTAEAVRHAVNFMVSHFSRLPQGDGPLEVPPRVQAEMAEAVANKLPPEVREWECTPAAVGNSATGYVITRIENQVTAEEAQRLGRPMHYLLDDEGYWQIKRDLGSGWERGQRK